jgi:MEDS: MEthanogen/methylotroph, DcmR Sensory domain
MGTIERHGSSNFHAVRFYKDAHSLCALVSSFLTVGFVASHPALVIATPEHRSGILEQLRWGGMDPVGLQTNGSLVLLDAQDTLDAFMKDGMPDSGRFTALVEPMLQSITQKHPDLPLRAYGEMVDVLWKQGRTIAATRLEMFWNDLARRYRFSLLCGYAMGNFYKDAAVEEICSHHTHVLTAAGAPAVIS